ncbi:MAG: M23 family metallopeptidase [bacterium]|nr:M23 family metallopeptidase [bacterium]
MQALLLQINDLLKQASIQEKEKSELVVRLTALKAGTHKTLSHYVTEINKLQQKKVYLTNFMTLYNQKKLDSLVESGFVSEFQVFNERIGNLVAEILEAQHKGNFVYSEALENVEQMRQGEEQAPVAWPAYPVGEILRIFKDPEFEQEYGVKHLGLQLALEQGTPVYAMRDGVVYHSEVLSGAVHWLVIAHTEGYISSYAYMNEIAVQPGEIVRRGQFIGQSGGEQGTQ